MRALRRATYHSHHALGTNVQGPPSGAGLTFATDVLRRECQIICVLRECVTLFTSVTLIADERSDTLPTRCNPPHVPRPGPFHWHPGNHLRRSRTRIQEPPKRPLLLQYNIRLEAV